MGFITGLNNINKRLADEEARFSKKGSSDSSDKPKTKWFSIKDKQSFKIIFLQELDADSPRFSEKNGLGALVIEHSNPEDFKRKALCTIDDEGSCFGCEQHRKDFKAKWGQKTKLYINVLVDDGENEPYVAVMNQGNGPKSITPALLEQAGEFDSITDTWFKVKRNGSGLTDTQYILTRLGNHDKDVESYDLFDLHSVVREVPYAQQEAYYYDGLDRLVEAEPAAELASAGSNAEW